MYDDESGPLRRLLYVAIVLTTFWLGLCCAVTAPPEEVRASVIETRSARTVTGDIRHYLTIEFVDHFGVTTHQRLEVEQREWLLFGREGAEICLHRTMGGWRMDQCK